MKVSDEMVEKACMSKYGDLWGTDAVPDDATAITRYEMRAALEAAIEGCAVEVVESTEDERFGIVFTDDDLSGKRVALVPLDD